MRSLVIGSAMIDTIAIVESERVERMTMRNADTSFLLLEEGRKTEALEISTHTGGGAMNVAVALARLGLDVAALVRLGRDARGDMVLARMKEEGIDPRWVVRDPNVPTGAAVHVASHERNAAIFTFRGANTLLVPGELADEAFAVDLVVVSSLSNQSADCFPLIVQKAKAAGAMVAANPGVRQLSARSGALHDCLGRIDILSINRVEADAMVAGLIGRFGEGGPALPLEPGEKPPGLAIRGLRSGGFEMSLDAFVGALLTLGPRAVVVTDGADGAFVGTRGQLVHCPVLTAEIAGTAGAGDGFVATFAAFVALGRGIADALRAATVNAASVMTHVDTQSGLLSLADIEARMAETAERLPLRTWTLAG
jgi:ribokinase